MTSRDTLLVDAVPPHDPEAEMAALGAMLASPDALGIGLAELRAADFFRPEHADLFRLIAEIARDLQTDERLDIVTVCNALRAAGLYDRIGGQAYLVTLVDSCPAPSNIRSYAKILRDKAALRRLRDAAAETLRAVSRPNAKAKAAQEPLRAAQAEIARRDAAHALAEKPIAAPTPVEPYRPFPVDFLPEPMRSFVAQAAEAVGCDAAFVALPLLAASASAIGNTRRIELKPGWTEPAILWASLVGDSGTLKSPAQELALRPLRRRQYDAMKQYDQEMKEQKVKALRYEIDLADWKKSGGEGPPPAEPQEPILSRCWCDDTTIEALAVLLVQNWRGLLMVRDELAGWLGGFDRYAQGKGGDAAKWLEMHGGRSITVDRKTGNPKTIHVPRAAVSLVGGIQPATLQRALGRQYFENGLAARLLLACPPRRVKQWTESHIDAATEAAVASMIDRLYTLEPVAGQNGDPKPGIVGLSPEAKRVWVCFYNEHAQEHVDLTGDLAAAWSKLEGYAARLALVAHFARWAAGDPTLASVNVVDETSITTGVTLSRWFGQETRRVYAILDETDVDRERRGLVEWVRGHGRSVTVRKLMRSSRAYSTSDTAEQALEYLVLARLGRWEDITPTAQGGRP